MLINTTHGHTLGTGEDYPTLGLLREKLKLKNVVPVFAVTSSVLPAYEELVDFLGIGHVKTIESDASVWGGGGLPCIV